MSDKALTSAELEVTQKIQTHFPRGLATEVLKYANECSVERLTAAVREMLEGLMCKVFCVTRGGKRTTEEMIAATKHTFVNECITSANFPLVSGPDEARELVAFQVDYDPTSEQVFVELEKRGLERPTHEDALKFDEAYPEEKGFFVFLHKPWLSSGGGPRVLVVYRVGAYRELDLHWFDVRWSRYDWVVGVRPRK
mgnify:FL=1